MIDADEMVALIESCRHEMQAMLPVDEFASLSSKTRQDYRQLGRKLLQRARYTEGGVAEVMTATQRPTTFYKRVAALRYCLPPGILWVIMSAILPRENNDDPRPTAGAA